MPCPSLNTQVPESPKKGTKAQRHKDKKSDKEIQRHSDKDTKFLSNRTVILSRRDPFGIRILVLIAMCEYISRKGRDDR